MLIDLFIHYAILHTQFSETNSLALMCFIYNKIVGLVTKGFHGCKYCGPSINDRWSNNLWKRMYKYSRVFLPKEHPYRRETSAFNGKPERTQRPTIMTPAEWLRAYERERRRKRLHKCLNQMGSLCSMIQNSSIPMLRNCSLGWKGNLSFMSSHIRRIIRLPTY